VPCPGCDQTASRYLPTATMIPVRCLSSVAAPQEA